MPIVRLSFDHARRESLKGTEKQLNEWFHKIRFEDALLISSSGRIPIS
uniref:Uncharacterized protein n=1 Tax=Utricularia reniformis TaxID=192314 RepID=A0A1Y0AZS5_9LAMI|nr:hypothetical protein AEK19_MT0371 [Utricularia reniformis]ART30643.1 hypothetical protein AEK19_MT0371 [Utricularia reniformis]